MTLARGAVGIGFRPVHYRAVVDERPRALDFFEIISENFLGIGGRPRRFLEGLRANYPVAMHGVSLSIGSIDRPSRAYLNGLAELNRRLAPTIVSDHLCWTHFGGHNSHDLLPVPLTTTTLRRIIEHLDEVQSVLGRRFYLENPSAYVAFKGAEWDEASFLAELIRRSGAGVILDLNNLYVNAHNLGLEPLGYLTSFKAEDIGYFHLAGHSKDGDVLIDTHDHPVPDAVWSLYQEAVRRFPGTPTLIEWDDRIPDLATFADHCEKAREIIGAVSQEATAPAPRETASPSRTAIADDRDLVRHFHQAITAETDDTSAALAKLATDLAVPAPRGLGVYRYAYRSRISEVLAETFPALTQIIGDEAFAVVADRYLSAHPPYHWSVGEAGEKLAYFLRGDPSSLAAVSQRFGVPLAALGDIAAVETAINDVTIAPNAVQTVSAADLTATELSTSTRITLISSVRLVDVAHDVWPVIATILNDGTPERPVPIPKTYIVYRNDDGEPCVATLENAEAVAARALFEGASLGQASEILTTAFDLSMEEAAAAIGRLLSTLVMQKSIAALVSG